MNNNSLNYVYVILILSGLNLFLLGFKIKQKQINTPNPPIISEPNQFSPFPLSPTIPEKEPEKSVEPKFEQYSAQRSVSGLGKVLGDIESHMPSGHIYKSNDKITWAHETTHGINSHIRMKFSSNNGYWSLNTFRSLARINGFYVLENRAVVIREPATTISATAKLVPRSLRGRVFNLYLVQQAGSWNDTPLYIFDEWTAYTNGSACRLDLGITSRGETVTYMLEFNVYAVAVAMSSQSQDQQFKSFLMWQIERAMQIYKDSQRLGPNASADSYLSKMRESADAAEFRSFAKSYFGVEWTNRVLGF